MALISTRIPKRRQEEPEAPIKPHDGPRYPYGLEISLEDELLKKLGITKLPQVGETINIRAVGSVTSVSERQDQRRESRDLRIQIEKIELKPAKKPTAEDAVSEAIDGLN